MPQKITQEEFEELREIQLYKQGVFKFMDQMEIGEIYKLTKEEIGKYETVAKCQSSLNGGARYRNIKVQTRQYADGDGIGLLVKRVG